MNTHQQGSVTFTLDEYGRLVAKLDHEQRQARTVLEQLGWFWGEEQQLLTAPADISLAAAEMAIAELQNGGLSTTLEPDQSTFEILQLTEAERLFQQLVEDRQPAANDREQARQAAPLQKSLPSYAHRYGTPTPGADVDPASHTMPL